MYCVQYVLYQSIVDSLLAIGEYFLDLVDFINEKSTIGKQADLWLTRLPKNPFDSQQSTKK